MAETVKAEVQMDAQSLMKMTSHVVASYVGNNALSVNDIPTLIGEVFRAFDGLTRPAEPEAPKVKPAVPIKDSVRDEYIVNLIDGRKYKSLKRTLSKQGLTPDEYRKMFNLRPDYPMVCPAYSKKRAQMAKDFGLGRANKKAA